MLRLLSYGVEEMNEDIGHMLEEFCEEVEEAGEVESTAPFIWGRCFGR